MKHFATVVHITLPRRTACDPKCRMFRSFSRDARSSSASRSDRWDRCEPRGGSASGGPANKCSPREVSFTCLICYEGCWLCWSSPGFGAWSDNSSCISILFLPLSIHRSSSASRSDHWDRCEPRGESASGEPTNKCSPQEVKPFDVFMRGVVYAGALERGMTTPHVFAICYCHSPSGYIRSLSGFWIDLGETSVNLLEGQRVANLQINVHRKRLVWLSIWLEGVAYSDFFFWLWIIELQPLMCFVCFSIDHATLLRSIGERVLRSVRTLEGPAVADLDICLQMFTAPSWCELTILY